MRQMGLSLFISILLQFKKGAQTKPAPKNRFRLLWGKLVNSFRELRELKSSPMIDSEGRYESVSGFRKYFKNRNAGLVSRQVFHGVNVGDCTAVQR